MIFFSTTFSPGAGVDGVKELRYLFSRYYLRLWCCMLSDDEGMEGCPSESNTLLHLIMSSLLLPFIFGLWKLNQASVARLNEMKKTSSQLESMKSAEFAELLVLKIYDEKAYDKLKHLISSDDLALLMSTHCSKYASEDDCSTMKRIDSDHVPRRRLARRGIVPRTDATVRPIIVQYRTQSLVVGPVLRCAFLLPPTANGVAPGRRS
jgi:hypothetical protein